MKLRTLLRAVLVLALAIVAAGCLSLWSRAKKEAGSALWLAEPSEIVAGPEMRRLEATGVRGLFLEAGELRAEGGDLKLVARTGLTLPRRLPVTLVLRGVLPTGTSASKQLAEQVHGLILGAEGGGLFVSGLHLDLEVEGRLGDLVGVAKALRKAIPDGRFLSVTVDRGRLEDEEASRLARATDYWVVFLHGQREGGRENPASWDLQVTERDMRKLEQVEEPYLIGVVTLGTASRVGRDGRVSPLPPAVALYPLLTSQALELMPGFSLQGIDRQVLELRAKSATHAAGIDLAAGERLRFVRTPTSVLEELQRLLGTWETPHRLGELFYRLPDTGDTLSLTPASLAAALEPGAAEPALEVELESLPAGRGRHQFRVHLRSTNDEPTDVGTLDHNYVSVQIPGGLLDDAEAGGFYRVEFDRKDEPSRVLALRRPDLVRLFAPLVEGRAVVVSGPVSVRYEGHSMRVTVGGEFVLTDGRVLSVPARDWELTP